MKPETELLLSPINPEHPAGDNLEDELLFINIRNARESDQEYLLHGEWSLNEPKKADWYKVSQLCTQALMNQSKDLQLACWLVESQSHIHGLAGLCSGAEFLSEFIIRFWYQCWPSIEDEGIAVRRSKLVRLDRDISQYLYCHQFLEKEITSLYHWQLVQDFEHKINSQQGDREVLIQQEGDLTLATFNLQIINLSSTEIRFQLDKVNNLLTIFEELETRYHSLSQDKDGALFTLTKLKLQDSTDYLQYLIQHAADPAAAHSDAIADELNNKRASNAAHSAESTMSRELAISQMLTIATWFRQTEPSSPVPFLIERATRWAGMTLLEWLEEMMSDSKSIAEINNLLTGQQHNEK